MRNQIKALVPLAVTSKDFQEWQLEQARGPEEC